MPSTYWRCDTIQTRTDYAGVLLLCVAFPRCDCQTRAKGDPTPGVTIRQRQDWSRRPMLPRGFALMVVIWLITGCAAIRPVSSPESRRLVARAVPEEKGEVVLAGPGTWFPNIRGFTDVRSILLYGSIAGIPGVLVRTSGSVLFQQWEEQTQRFDVVRGCRFRSSMRCPSIPTVSIVV